LPLPGEGLFQNFVPVPDFEILHFGPLTFDRVLTQPDGANSYKTDLLLKILVRKRFMQHHELRDLVHLHFF
jgi:hypothetical protein